MRADLDRLRLAVDEATTQLIAAECDLDAARNVERGASAARVSTETVRNAAVTRLSEARVALDRRLGIPVTAPALVIPRPAEVLAQYALYHRTAGEKLMQPGAWRDSGIRGGSSEEVLEIWRARPAVERDWLETDVRLVRADDRPPAPMLPTGWEDDDEPVR